MTVPSLLDGSCEKTCDLVVVLQLVVVHLVIHQMRHYYHLRLHCRHPVWLTVIKYVLDFTILSKKYHYNYLN